MWWIIESKKYSCIFRMTQLCDWICNNLSCMHLLLLTEIAIIFYSITENKPHSDIGCCLAGRTIVVRDYPLPFTQLTWQTR